MGVNITINKCCRHKLKCFKNIVASVLIIYNFMQYNYVSQFIVEAYCFADGRCLLKQPRNVIYHWNQYDKDISKC